MTSSLIISQSKFRTLNFLKPPQNILSYGKKTIVNLVFLKLPFMVSNRSFNWSPWKILKMIKYCFDFLFVLPTKLENVDFLFIQKVLKLVISFYFAFLTFPPMITNTCQTHDVPLKRFGTPQSQCHRFAVCVRRDNLEEKRKPKHSSCSQLNA